MVSYHKNQKNKAMSTDLLQSILLLIMHTAVLYIIKSNKSKKFAFTNSFFSSDNVIYYSTDFQTT